ncbi:MAG: hypothetical protein ACO1OX_12565 [Novosphingobium sp.]
MKQTYIRLLMVAPVALSLSGCGVMKKLGIFHGPRTAKAAVQVASADALTQIGRSQLDENNPGLAAKSFEQALAAGEKPAPAFNGLGVAYARMGRADLAARYFGLAAKADPENERYSANLATLHKSTQMARLRAPDPQSTKVAQASATAPFASPTAKEEGRIVRLSPVEVKIVIPPFEAKHPEANAFVRIDLEKAGARRKRTSEK